MPTELQASQLASAIRRDLRYIAARIDEVSWSAKLQPFEALGAELATAIESALKSLAFVAEHPKQPTGTDAAATAALGPLTLTAVAIGEDYNDMTAEWSPGSVPPEQAAGFSGGATFGVGYLTISGNPTEDFDGLVEITSDGAVGVGSFRFSINGGTTWAISGPIAAFSHAGISVTFADDIDIPDVVPGAAGELPLTANYVAPARASWSSRGFDKLTITHGATVESYDYLRPGAAWFVEGSAASGLLSAAEWSSQTRPTPQTVEFSGGSSRVLPPPDEGAAFRGALDDAYLAGLAWRRKWNVEISSYVVTRSPTPPPSL